MQDRTASLILTHPYLLKMDKESTVKTHPFISVVITVYNAVDDLKMCLQALKRSDYSAFEILVVDDGSTDDSAVVAQRYGARFFSSQSNRSCCSQELGS